MNGRELFKIWAPEGMRWTDWARPVPFINLDSDGLYGVAQIAVPKRLCYLDRTESNCAIMIDVPDHHAIGEAIALAKIGWRPVPLYNGCDAQDGVCALLDNRDIKDGLILGAAELQQIELSSDAPPVFLLDTTRVNQYKMSVAVFDNSWDLFAQDFPTAQCFLKYGINKIIVRTDKIRKDLKPILYSFQKNGIKILITDGYAAPKEIKLKKQRG